MIKFNYILNDLALSNLVTRSLYSQNANCEDKEELENQIKLIMQENTNLRIQISAKEKEYKKLEETNKVQSQELTKDKILKQAHLTTCCGISIGDMPKLIEKNKKLENNWDELKFWLKKELGDRINPNNDKWLTGVYDAYKETIDKITELEKGVSDAKD